MGALSNAKPLLAIAAGELHLHPAVLTFIVLAVAVLISRTIIPSLDFLVARRRAAGEPRLLLHPTGIVEAAAAPAGSAPRSPLAGFVVLCFAMATVLHAEPLVHAAELRLGPAAVVFGVLTAAVLFDCVIISINHFVAHRPAEREPRTLLLLLLLQLRRTVPAASTTMVRPSSLARPALVVLAALTSASWFVEPLVHAAAELRLPRVAVVITVALFAALFNFSVHSFRSFFLTRRPPVAAA